MTCADVSRRRRGRWRSFSKSRLKKKASKQTEADKHKERAEEARRQDMTGLSAQYRVLLMYILKYLKMLLENKL